MKKETKTGLAYVVFLVESCLYSSMHHAASPIRRLRRAWWQAKYGDEWIQKYMEHQRNKREKKMLKKHLRARNKVVYGKQEPRGYIQYGDQDFHEL